MILLKNGFYFNTKEEKLFCYNEEVYLTKTEFKLFKLLIINLNQITKIEDISQLVWGKRNFSKNLLRTYIGKIKDKTYPNLIKNKSSVGYIMIN